MAGSSPRQDLLDAAVTYVSHHGVGDLSLRELARAIGTSHRMLIYHFGSKQRLLVAIVEAIERTQREALADASAEVDRSPVEMVRWVWDRVADPSMWPSERLFFELYGQALQGRPGTTALLDSIITSWVEPAVEFLSAQRMEPDDAGTVARLNLAVVRGLLLDLLTTRDRGGVDRCMDLFLSQADPVSGH